MEFNGLVWEKNSLSRKQAEMQGIGKQHSGIDTGNLENLMGEATVPDHYRVNGLGPEGEQVYAELMRINGAKSPGQNIPDKQVPEEIGAKSPKASRLNPYFGRAIAAGALITILSGCATGTPAVSPAAGKMDSGQNQSRRYVSASTIEDAIQKPVTHDHLTKFAQYNTMGKEPALKFDKPNTLNAAARPHITIQNETSDKLIHGLVDYLKSKHIERDFEKEIRGLDFLMRQGISWDDIIFYDRLNKHLISRGYFLTDISHNDGRVIRLNKIKDIQKFEGFVDDSGKERSDIFGFKFSPYNRYLLGEESFTNNANAPVYITFYKHPDLGVIIGIPSTNRLGGYRNSSPDTLRQIIESETMHEIAHLLFRTPFEKFAMTVEYGYRLDEGVSINSPQDIVQYLSTKNPKQTEFGRILLDKLFFKRGGFGPYNRSADSLVNDVREITAQVHTINPSYPADSLKISDQQLYATMRLIFGRFEPLFKQYRR